MKKTRCAIAIVLTVSLLAAFVGAAVAEEALLLTDGRKAVLQKDRLLILVDNNQWKVAPVGKYVTTGGLTIKVGSEGITTYYKKP
jgi:hypothetical protein